MGTWNAFYVKVTDEQVEGASLLIQREFEGVTVDGEGDWLGVDLGLDAFHAPEMKLSALSDRLNTSVIFLSFQSVVDAFQFYMWKNGVLTRRLIYGCFGEEERTWENVDGVPEPWEGEVFFGQKKLERALDYSDAVEQEELRYIWQGRILTVGATTPSLDSRSAAWEIATYYKLPHFS